MSGLYTVTVVMQKGRHRGEWRDMDCRSVGEATSLAAEADSHGLWACIIAPDGQPIGSDEVVQRWRRRNGQLAPDWP